MMPDYTTNVLLIVGLVLLSLLVWLVTRRKAAGLTSRFRKVSKAYLADFLIPDGQGGQILIEHALLCSRGIVIIDVKDVEGNVFGSDAMHDWTVITGKSRFTFANPQPGMFDRTAAVAHLLPDIPVTGVVAFSDRGKFTKGLPGHVVNLNELLKELASEAKGKSAALDAYWPAWEKLRTEAVVAQVDRLIRD